MPPKSISQDEVQRYWEIFATLAAGGSYLDGSQAASVLKDSGLSETQLERIWDLADVDGDGRLDFEEFCVAMRLIYDMVNGEYAAVPATLPEWLVPSSKAHLVQAQQALSGAEASFERPSYDEEDEGLRDGFDWYMPPSDAAKYSEIYRANSDRHGDVTFAALAPLYESLDVPDTDVQRAWRLVNPGGGDTIGKDACLAFLHVLNNRHEGYRLPRSVPASLRASFERRTIDYTVAREQTSSPQRSRWADDSTGQGKKARFGEAYLSRIGLGGGTNYSKGTDFSKDADWEEVRLKKQLAEITAKIDRIENQNANRKGGRRSDSKPQLVRKELEQMLDYKRRTLRELDSGDGNGLQEGKNLKGLQEEVDSVREQVEGLERHWKTRQEALEGLRDEAAAEKA